MDIVGNERKNQVGDSCTLNSNSYWEGGAPLRTYSSVQCKRKAAGVWLRERGPSHMVCLAKLKRKNFWKVVGNSSKGPEPPPLPCHLNVCFREGSLLVCWSKNNQHLCGTLRTNRIVFWHNHLWTKAHLFRCIERIHSLHQMKWALVPDGLCWNKILSVFKGATKLLPIFTYRFVAYLLLGSERERGRDGGQGERDQERCLL